MMRKYKVVILTEDWDEIVYEYQTMRGAFAATEAVVQKHSRAGHKLSDVRAVHCEEAPYSFFPEGEDNA